MIAYGLNLFVIAIFQISYSHPDVLKGKCTGAYRKTGLKSIKATYLKTYKAFEIVFPLVIMWCFFSLL